MFKNAFWKFSSNGVEYAVAFIQSILLARILGVKKFGVLVLITTYVTIINKIIDFRVWESVVKFVSEYKEKNDKSRALAVIKISYIIDLITGIIAFFVVYFTAGIISEYLLKQPGLENPIIIFSLNLLITTVRGTSTALHRVFGRYRRLGVIDAFFSVSTLIFVAVTLLFISKELTGVLWSLVFAALINNILLNISAVDIIKPYFKKIWKSAKISLIKNRFKEMTHFLFHSSFNYLLTLFTKDVDVMILNFFHGASAVGIYQVAKKLAKSTSFVIDPLYFAVYPDLASLFSKRKIKEIKIYILNLMKILILLSIPIGLIIFLFGKPIILLFYGQQYENAFFPLRIMIFGVFIALLTFWTRPALLSVGKPQVLTYAHFFSALTMFLLSLIVVSRYGYIGSAIMFVYPYIITKIIIIIMLRKVFHSK